MGELASLNLYKRVQLDDLVIVMDDELTTPMIGCFITTLTSKRNSQILNKQLLDYYTSQFDEAAYEKELEMDRW